MPEDGKYLLQIAAPKGSKTFKIDISLGTLASSPTPTPRLSPSPSPSHDLTQDEAEKLVKRWYEVKRQAFGSSFDDSLVKQYATGELYSNALEKCNDGICGGTVGWLRSKG
ncbi:MAG: IMS domain-containing protein, partial [Microcystis panniformis]